MLELNKIYNMDNMAGMAQTPDKYFELTITSPPYNLGETHHTGGKRFKAYNSFSDNLPELEYQQQQIGLLNEIYRVTKDGGSLLYNHKNRIKNGVQISPYQWLLKTEWTFKQEIVWFNRSQNFDKCRFYPMTERIYWLSKGVETDFKNTINQHDLITDNAEGTDKEHKRAFPLSLAKRFIMCFPNAKTVFDPYMGSGTTAVAAIDCGKNYMGFEIDKEYYDKSIERINQFKSQPKISFEAPVQHSQSILF